MPTHPLLHVRNAADAHIVFEAVRLGLLPLIRRRLTPAERDGLTSGQVFVWEETDISGGLSRWTDGRRWSQSRMREPFLFYEEKVLPTLEEKRAKAERRARKAKLDPLSASFGQQHQHLNSQFSTSTFPSSPSTSSTSSSSYDDKPCRRQDRPSKPDGLTKQTYSSFVPASASMISSAKKWHIVAYFNTSSYASLPTVDDYPELKVLTVREGTWGAASSAALAAAAVKNSKSERGVHSGLLTRQIVPRFSPSGSDAPHYFRDGSEDVEMMSVDDASNSGGSSFSYSATSSSASNASASGSPAPSFTSLPTSRSTSVRSSYISSSHYATTTTTTTTSGYPSNQHSAFSSPAPSSPYLFSPLSSSVSSSPRSSASRAYTSSTSSSISSTPSVSVASLLNPASSSAPRSTYSTYSSSSSSCSLSSFSTMSSVAPAPTQRQTPALPAPRCAEDARALGAFRITF